MAMFGLIVVAVPGAYCVADPGTAIVGMLAPPLVTSCQAITDF
jgi:hypothetical protein